MGARVTSPFVAVAVAAVRAWTRLYTWRLRTSLRDARRAEIESDLWELQHDPAARRGVSLAAHIAARLILGIPADMLWRAEHMASVGKPIRRVVALTATGVALVFLWVFF